MSQVRYVDIFEATDLIGVELGNHLSVAENRLESANAEIADLHKELEAAGATIAVERTTVQNLSRALANMAIPTPTTTAKTESIPTPPKFNGNRARLRAWKNAVNLKLSGDSARFPSEQHRLAYVFALLEGKAMDQIQPYVLETGIKLDNVSALFVILDRAFGDPNAVGTAS